MRSLLFLLRKEFLQIVKNRQMLPIIFIMPIMQLLILANAADFDVKNIKWTFVDCDKSEASRGLVYKFISNQRFIFVGESPSESQAEEKIKNRDASMTLVIPKNFERDLARENRADAQFIVNSEDGASAGVIQGYSLQIVNAYNSEIAPRFIGIDQTRQTPISILETNWYNSEMNYKFYMAPGILAILVVIIGMFLSAMNIVKEKEIGTIEQINVTPITKRAFILGKLIPYWCIALFDLALGLFLCYVIFDMPIRGNLFLIFGVSGIFLVAMQSFGLIISTLTETQQQAMFIAWFFMVISILLGGLFTPISSMPVWAQNLTLFNPMRHYIEAMRRMLLKGSNFFEIGKEISIISAFAVALFTVAIASYRKSTN